MIPNVVSKHLLLNLQEGFLLRSLGQSMLGGSQVLMVERRL